MTTLTITIEESIEAQLLHLGEANGLDPDELAARLLTRAVLAARPRPIYDLDAMRASAFECNPESLVLADSDGFHRGECSTDEGARQNI